MLDKFYVVYDDVHDFRFYRMLQEWKEDPDLEFGSLPSGDLDPTHKSIPLVVLIGMSTRYLDSIDQIITQALLEKRPIIGVNLNGLRFQDNNQCPEVLQNKLAVHICFNRLILKRALETWPEYHKRFIEEQKPGPYYYGDNHYADLGLL